MEESIGNRMSLTMRWSEDGYLSRIVLTHVPRQVSVSLILGVRQKNMKSPLIAFVLSGLLAHAQGIEMAIGQRSDQNAIIKGVEWSGHDILAAWMLSQTEIDSATVTQPSRTQLIRITTGGVEQEFTVSPTVTVRLREETIERLASVKPIPGRELWLFINAKGYYQKAALIDTKDPFTGKDVHPKFLHDGHLIFPLPASIAERFKKEK